MLNCVSSTIRFLCPQSTFRPSQPINNGSLSEGCNQNLDNKIGDGNIKNPWSINPLSEAALDQEIVAVFDEPLAEAEVASAIEVGFMGGNEGADDMSSIKACWNPADQREEATHSPPEVIVSNLIKWQYNNRDGSGPEYKSSKNGILEDKEKEERRVREMLGAQIRCGGKGSRLPADIQDEYPILLHELTKRFPSGDKVSPSWFTQ